MLTSAKSLFAAGLVATVLLSSCLQDDIAPTIALRNAAGDTIVGDTLTATLNTVLTLVSSTRDDQDLGEVAYYQGYPDDMELRIDYAAPIDLTNRIREVFVDLSFPDSLYASGDFGTFRVYAEDREGNVTELFKRIRVQ